MSLCLLDFYVSLLQVLVKVRRINIVGIHSLFYLLNIVMCIFALLLWSLLIDSALQTQSVWFEK